MTALFLFALFVLAPAPPVPAQVRPPAVSAESKTLLAKLGWRTAGDGGLVRLNGSEKGSIPAGYLEKAGLEWNNGALSFMDGDAISAKQLPMILEGLRIFARAAEVPPAEAGKALAAWSLPPVIDGRKIVNPDGSATYYGQMLRLIYAEKPDALQRAGAERLSQALDLLSHAREQAFEKQSPDVAKADVDRAKLILFMPTRPGETPFDVKPYEDLGAQLAGFKSEIAADKVAAAKAGDADRARDSAAALDVLATLERQRYHIKEALPEVPPPGTAPAAAAPDNAPNAPLSSGLPRLLRTLDRINGAPLTHAQQENLIKSFPMGDLVWRLGVQDLWRQGLTGKGSRVGIIDGEIEKNDELAEAVKSRANLTADRGTALTQEHSTHIAGIVHALAPDAEIRGYAVFTNDGANPVLKESNETLVLNAIDRAVKDKNNIITMSFESGGSPSEMVARKIEEYSKKGVVFVAAAGNQHDKNGISAPSVAPNALTAGALDGAGRAADFSSYGANFDARKIAYVVKTVFMLPGTNIYSTVGRSGYSLMDGTSMATPALGGVIALLAPAAAAMTPDPVELSSRLRDALVAGSVPMSLDKLPSVPFDQQFLIVQPQQALDALRRQAAPSMAGGPR